MFNTLMIIVAVIFILTSIAHMAVQTLALIDRYKTRDIVRKSNEIARKSQDDWLSIIEEDEDDIDDRLEENKNLFNI